jgi:hypothetical protein
MSARKAKRRPKARKERVYEVAGHELTKEQQADFERELKQLWRQFPNWTAEAREERALSNCLYRWRPSVRAHDTLQKRALYERVSQAMHALMGLIEWPMHICGLGGVRMGSVLIEHVAGELEAVAKELRDMQVGISTEIREAAERERQVAEGQP